MMYSSTGCSVQYVSVQLVSTWDLKCTGPFTDRALDRDDFPGCPPSAGGCVR